MAGPTGKAAHSQKGLVGEDGKDLDHGGNRSETVGDSVWLNKFMRK